MASDASDGLSLGFEIFWLDDLIRDSVHSPYGTFLRLDQDKLG